MSVVIKSIYTKVDAIDIVVIHSIYYYRVTTLYSNGAPCLVTLVISSAMTILPDGNLIQKFSLMFPLKRKLTSEMCNIPCRIWTVLGLVEQPNYGFIV